MMKFFFSLLLFLLPFTSIHGDEAEAIIDAWEDFTEACHERNGSDATKYVSSASREYYSEIQKLAVSATKEEIQALPLGKQVTTLSIRMRVSPEDLQRMSGEALFIHSIDKGWIGKPRSEDETIAEIESTGNTATAKESVGGEITEHVVHFLKEDEQWKFDMLPTIRLVDETFETTCAESGESEEDFVEAFLKLITGESDVGDAWTPPLPLDSEREE
ncbi:MAG: hypothetical protein CMO55_02555 [Verrucomicrobiales bacterium]|nr:hypothetical protein [Verrucomicrobiales bacterium]